MPKERTRCGTRMPWLPATLSSCTCTGMQAQGEEEETAQRVLPAVLAWLGLLTHCSEGVYRQSGRAASQEYRKRQRVYGIWGKGVRVKLP